MLWDSKEIISRILLKLTEVKIENYLTLSHMIKPRGNLNIADYRKEVMKNS